MASYTQDPSKANATNVQNPYDFKGVSAKPPPSSYQRGGVGSRAAVGTAQQRLGTAMKANQTAGFRSKPVPEGMAGNLASNQPVIEEKKEQSDEEKFKELEEEVHRLLEDSASHKLNKKPNEALQKAKDAALKEKKIRQLREMQGALDQVNIDLTFYVFYNLANMYHFNGMHQESINSYTIILKNKQYPQAARLRVNMGNIYFEQKKYDQAIKNYNMAIDSTTQQNKDMKMKIKKNVGLALVKQKRFGKAIEIYEDIMNDAPDFDIGFNLIVCLYALGEKEKMRTWFEKFLMLEIPGVEEEEQEELILIQKKEENKMSELDPLREYLKTKKKVALNYVSKAAKLVAPFVENNIFDGYNYVIQSLKTANLPEVESEMEIAKAIHFIKNKEIEKAIESFKSFEKKDKIMMAMASNNISFLYFLENDFKQAEHFADLAIQHDRYNSKALVNKGNTLFVAEEYDRAKEFFLEAIGVEADCIEAIYNLGLVYKRLGYYNESLQAFEKLHTIIPNSYEVLYQIAHVYELIGMRREALKWYNILITQNVQSDSEILAKMGYLYQQEQDEFQAVHFYQESYRYNPSKIDVISCLGMHHAKQDMFEKAIIFFERASQIQPKEVKWALMIASCYRRMNLFQEALKVYEEIYEDNQDNIDCLRGIVSIRRELGLKFNQFQEKLAVLDREEEAKRQYEYAQNQQFQARQMPNFNMGTAPAAQISEMPDMSDIPGPAAKNQRRMGGPAPAEEDEGWDTGALLA